jgi:hypothetical protein
MTDEVSNMATPRPGALRREIIGLLAIKLIALSVLFFVFFGPSARPHITTQDLAAHLTSAVHQTH